MMVGAVGVALVWAGAAEAQTSVGESASTAVPGEKENVAGEIVVTAQKRAENVQDVPASVSVVGAAQLENLHVTQLTDIAAYVPGFQVDSGGSPGQTTINLRGISAVGGDQTSTVGTYLDDTPVGSSSFFARADSLQLDLLPYDFERLEVLRGPQGTLYGAGSIGGLVKYVTRAPDLDRLEVRAGGEVFGIADAHDFGWSGRVGINAPIITDTLGIRASYAYHRAPGYIDNLFTGERDQNSYVQQGGRVALLWKARAEVSVRLSALWQKVDSDDNATVASTLPPGSVELGSGRSDVNRLSQPFRKNFAHFGATVDWDAGFGSLTSATSYSNVRTSATSDVSDVYGVLFPLFDPAVSAGLSSVVAKLDLKKWTQEIRLTSPTGSRFEWLLGGFYTHEKSGNVQNVSALSGNGTAIASLDPLAIVSVPTTYQEYAFFANATYRFSDLFRVTGGVRYAHNSQEFAQISSGFLLPTGTVNGSSAEGVWTYAISPQLHLGDNTMIYARVASGYRPGGPNFFIFGDPPPPTVGADTLTNYEFGLKSDFLDRRAVLDLSLFYMDWNNIQISVTRNGTGFTANAGGARSQGAELSLLLRPTRGFSVAMNGAYVDAKLTEDAAGAGAVTGDRLSRSPKWSASVLADYEFLLSGAWAGHFGGGIRLVSDRPQGFPGSSSFVVADGYQAIDLNAEVGNGKWAFKAYVKNLTDSHAELSSSVLTSALGDAVRRTGTPLQPRTIGLAVDVRY